MPVDLIPFGPIASDDRTITWPPHRDIVLNVAGFEEALRSAVILIISEELNVKVASLPGLAILKLLAWHDRRRQNNKDAADLHTLLTAYAAGENLDRLYGEEFGVLEDAGFDVDPAGAQLLVRDVARICDGTCLRRVEEILRSERLAEAADRTDGGSSQSFRRSREPVRGAARAVAPRAPGTRVERFRTPGLPTSC